MQGINIQTLYSLHETEPPELDHEPKYLDSDSLLGLRPTNRRVQASILSHNEIVWQSGGSMADHDAEITDMNIPQGPTRGLANEGSSYFAESNLLPTSPGTRNANHATETMSSLIDRISETEAAQTASPNALRGFDIEPWDGILDPALMQHDVNPEQLSSFDNWLNQFQVDDDFQQQLI